MSLPLPPNGIVAPHCVQPPQQPGLPSLDVSQSNPWDSHLNNTRHPGPSNDIGSFPMAASDVPRSSVQNVDPPPQPFHTNGQISWDCIWPLLMPSVPDRSSHHLSAPQNTQATSACPTCPTHPTHPTSGPVQSGGGRPNPAIQGPTAPLAPAPSSSSSCPNPPAPHTAPPVPVPEAPSFRPGVVDAGPTTANAYPRRPKRARPTPRRAREVPLVRIEDRIEWVSRDVMKMTLWFNWSPDAEAEAHDEWG